MRRHTLAWLVALAAAVQLLGPVPAGAQQKRAAVSNTPATAPQAPAAAPEPKRPNILVIFGDDIGMWNVGAYTHGMMGRTPNIDSLARGGMLFTDHYSQASCTTVIHLQTRGMKPFCLFCLIYAAGDDLPEAWL